ncbi:MAG: GNAT family N-acetyltransferase [Alistipes sp.]|nr:GNAT family N-acetyltransferase [Alistipes sp.]
MKEIIPAIDRAVILDELSKLDMLRTTRHGANEIYVFNAQSSPNLMREVGRLRELSFRSGGGGSGNELDVDADDMAQDGYEQLIAWDPVAQEIIGGYRFIICRDSQPAHLSTEHYFNFSQQFRDEYLPHTLELGRAFVSGSGDAMKSIYALDNLWDGIGALLKTHPEVKYLLGKVTMYSSYNIEARNMFFYFLRKYYPDTDRLVEGIHPLKMNINAELYDALFTGANFDEDYKILRSRIRDHEEIIPPMFNAYINITASMRVFDSVYNPELGDVYETGILVPVESIYSDKYERYTTW